MTRNFPCFPDWRRRGLPGGPQRDEIDAAAAVSHRDAQSRSRQPHGQHFKARCAQVFLSSVPAAADEASGLPAEKGETENRGNQAADLRKCIFYIDEMWLFKLLNMRAFSRESKKWERDDKGREWRLRSLDLCLLFCWCYLRSLSLTNTCWDWPSQLDLGSCQKIGSSFLKRN